MYVTIFLGQFCKHGIVTIYKIMKNENLGHKRNIHPILGLPSAEVKDTMLNIAITEIMLSN